jgi:hypothetical protein
MEQPNGEADTSGINGPEWLRQSSDVSVGLVGRDQRSLEQQNYIVDEEPLWADLRFSLLKGDEGSLDGFLVEKQPIEASVVSGFRLAFTAKTLSDGAIVSPCGLAHIKDLLPST